jgi:hypothetical protein
MFKKYIFDNYNDYDYTKIIKKTDKKSPSNILSEKIKFNKTLSNIHLKNKLNKKGEETTRLNFSYFINNDNYTNDISDNILCNNYDNCLTRNIFNIMCLCCNLTYSLVNQTRVNIIDYFYTTNLIEELCIYYTLNDNSSIRYYTRDQNVNTMILQIIKIYYSIMNNIKNLYAEDSDDKYINEHVKMYLNFLITDLKTFIKSKEIKEISDTPKKSNISTKTIKTYVNEINEINSLIFALNEFKSEIQRTKIINEYNINNLYLNKIQNINTDHYKNFFKNAYNIIYDLVNPNKPNEFNINYKKIYTYNYPEIIIDKLIKLRTYLLLMFIYRIRFINLDDVDDKGGRQAEFFISVILRDFYNYFYIDNIKSIDDKTKSDIKEIYDNILVNLLTFHFYNDINEESNNFIFYVYNNTITIKYINGNDSEIFRPFEKMFNIKECSHNKITGSNGNIGGDLIYLHECYTNNQINDQSICIIIDSKAYQDSTYITDNKIDKTIIQCYLYSQYVKECYKNNIFNNNIYLCVVNPIYGSYYVYDYNNVRMWLNSIITYDYNKQTTLINYLSCNNYKLLNNDDRKYMNCDNDRKRQRYM